MSPLVRNRRLAATLRTLREAHSMTGTKLAQVSGIQRTVISGLENASGRPDVAHVIKLLEVFGVTGDEWHTIVQVAQDAGTVGWWESQQPHIGARQATYANLEAGATSINEYQAYVVPGLLQTPDYIRSRRNWDQIKGVTPKGFDIEKVIGARVARQRMVNRSGGPAYVVVLEEVAVRRVAAPPDVMRAQLKHLVDIADSGGPTSIRVLPVEATFPDHWLPRSSFALYRSADLDDPEAVAVDTETTDLVYTTPDKVEPYRELFTRVEAAALSAKDSLNFLIGTYDTLSTRIES